MKIAIHLSKNNFSEQWINYCEKNKLPYKIVNCYDSNIISQLEDCNGLMWHWTLNDYKAALFAHQITLALEKKGINVFPNVNSGWHYDDKVGQKYLLEAIGAPLPGSHVFYAKEDALKWLENIIFPIVFKLRSGAASNNVSLVKNIKKAKNLVNRAFNKGFSHLNNHQILNDRMLIFKKEKNLQTLMKIVSGLLRIFIPSDLGKFSHNEKGYIYFQDFIPNNNYDFRIKVIESYCWGFRRAVRKNDFRASGSGILDFDVTKIPLEMVQIAFDLSQKLNLQSVAFDFVLDQQQQPLIIEMSYCFGFDERELTNGFWTSDLTFHKEYFNPFDAIIINFVNKCRK